ncbi:MAG: LuxR C-terminal-related transcriptional regulator [Chloroflexota bacterium]|nr:LuxR C-terminal-related transcriptional regulator [Chloroflexota bacterium]
MNNRDLSGDVVYADDLTWREQEVLILLAERLTNQEIADRLHLAESTVKDYVGKILSKLYVKNRRQAVERAKALGLLDPDRKTVVRSPINLPAEPTPFVGRRDELAEIKRNLGETRLLTLTGPGGMGKTRLALKAAEGASDDYEDGIFFVPLAPIRSVEHLIQTIAEGLKFPLATHEDPQHQLLRYLKKKQLLLVMDNFEHLLDGTGIVSGILQAAPAVKILATSRERLNLLSETIFTVGGMETPNQEGSEDPLYYDAIVLFVQSASKLRPGFDPSPDELGQIEYISQSVGGMPLGIELAAAWLHILNVDEITEELEKGLDILATEVRDAPQRHRSIRAVFNHSWSLLHQAEQEIFMLLSVFRGGFTREAAQQVSGASLQLLASLVDKSFLSHDPNSGRLEVHELLRQYAQERLEETPEASFSAQGAHAAYYAEFMQERWGDLKGSRQMRALAEIEADIENVRAAWRYCLEQRNIPQIWKFINGLWYVYWIRWWNHAGMELFGEAARALQGEESEEAAATRALAMAFQGYFMGWLDLADRGYELAKECVAILGGLNHPDALVFAYVSLAVNAYFLNRFTEHIKAVNKMLEIATEMDDKWLLAFALWGAGLGALLKEDYPEARRLAESNLSINEEIGDVIGSTLPLIVLGHAALALGEYEGARGIYLRCLKISQEAGFHYAIQTSSKYLGKVALAMGKVTDAENYLLQSLRITKEIGFMRDIINLFYEYARLRVAQDEPEQAAELLALVLQHPASRTTRMLEGSIRDSARDLLAELEDELPPATYTAALERGRDLELDEVIADLVAPKS